MKYINNKKLFFYLMSIESIFCHHWISQVSLKITLLLSSGCYNTNSQTTEIGFKLLHECFQLCSGRMNKSGFFAYRVCFLNSALHLNFSFKISMIFSLQQFFFSTISKQNLKESVDISMKAICKCVHFKRSLAFILKLRVIAFIIAWLSSSLTLKGYKWD